MLKLRPYTDFREASGTEKQRAARDRSWRIFKLRGLYAQVSLLTGERRTVARALVDQELALLGAESETKRVTVAAIVDTAPSFPTKPILGKVEPEPESESEPLTEKEDL